MAELESSLWFQSLLSVGYLLGSTWLGFSALEIALGHTLQKNIPRSVISILGRNAAVLLVTAVCYLSFGFDLMYGLENWPWWQESTEEDFFGYGGIGLLTMVTDAGIQLQMAYTSTQVFVTALALAVGLVPRLIAAGLFSLLVYPFMGSLHWGGGILGEINFVDGFGAVVIYTLGTAAYVGWRLASPQRVFQREVGSNSYGTIRIFSFVLLLICWGAPNFSVAVLEQFPIYGIGFVSGVFVGVIVCLFFRPRDWVEAGALSLVAVMVTLAGGLGYEGPFADVEPESNVSLFELVLFVLGSVIVAVLLNQLLKRFRARDPIGATAAFGVPGVIGCLYLARMEGVTLLPQLTGVLLTLAWGGVTGAVMGLLHRVFITAREGAPDPESEKAGP